MSSFKVRKTLFTSKWGRILPDFYWESIQGHTPAIKSIAPAVLKASFI